MRSTSRGHRPSTSEPHRPYAPQKGPPVYIQLGYNQREAGQPQNFGYFNVGRLWTLNVLSFVEDAPAQPASGGTVVRRSVPGGGFREHAGYNLASGAFAPEEQTGAVLTRVPAAGTAFSYTLTQNDGSTLVYGHQQLSPVSPE